MAEQIISASGIQYGMIVNSDGSLNVVASGVQISIGSAVLQLEDVYVRSGNVYVVDEVPTSSNKTNPKTSLVYISSGTSTGVTGSSIGSIYQIIGTGSYVKSLIYSNNNLISVSAWTSV